MSRPGWLTYSGRFTHISGQLSAAGRAEDRVRWSKTDILPLCHATKQATMSQFQGGMLALHRSVDFLV